MSLYQPTRDQARQFLFDTWSKYNASQTLTALEKIALDIILMHPEYHVLLEAPDQIKAQEFYPEMGETNPFLHINLHLSVIEQIQTNQPIGIKPAYDKLLAHHQDQHEAQHALLECLAETIWQAQSQQKSLDSAHYLQLIQERTKDLA